MGRPGAAFARCLQVPSYPRRCLPRFKRAQRFFRQFARGGEAVAPGCIGHSRIGPGFGCFTLHRRQPQHTAVFLRRAAVLAKTFVAVARLRGLHDGVDGADHGHAVAPGMVASQQVTPQAVAHERLRGDKHLRLGAAKAVNALLRVTNDKHTRCPARTAIAA